jgi:hypothetical protein
VRNFPNDEKEQNPQMKKTKISQRIISLLLTFIILCGLIPATLYAAPGDYVWNGAAHA